jgi:hypothetical protein
MGISTRRVGLSVALLYLCPVSPTGSSSDIQILPGNFCGLLINALAGKVSSGPRGANGLKLERESPKPFFDCGGQGCRITSGNLVAGRPAGAVAPFSLNYASGGNSCHRGYTNQQPGDGRGAGRCSWPA